MTKRKFLSSLRSRIAALAALSILPGLILVVAMAAQDRNLAVKNVDTENLIHLRQARLIVTDKIESVQSLLSVLTEADQVIGDDQTACNAFLARIIAQSEGYSSLAFYRPNGDLWCSAPLPPNPVNSAQREFFQNAISQNGFALGGFQIGAITGKAVFTFGSPIKDKDGRLQGVVAGGIDVEKLNAKIDSLKLPEGYAVDVTDAKGTFIVRWPQPRDYIGKSFPDAPINQYILKTASQGGDYTTNMPGVDGVQRLYAFSVVPGTNSAMFIRAGISPEVALQPINDRMTRSLQALVICAILSIFGGWLLGDILIGRRTQSLAKTAQRLSGGDLSARTEVPHTEGELGQLAAALDEMAGQIQQRAQERNAAVKQLTQANEAQRLLADVSTASVKSLNYAESLQDIVNTMCETFTCMAALGVTQPDNTIKMMTTCHRNPDKLKMFDTAARETFPVFDLNSDDPRVLSIKRGESMLYRAHTGAFGSEAHHQKFWADYQMGTMLVVPLIQRGRVLGVLSVIREEENDPFSADEVKLAEAFAARIAAALDSMRLYHELQSANASLEQQVSKRTQQLVNANTRLRQSQQDIRNFAKRQNEAIEAERTRIAREVHDQIGQALTSIKMDLSAALRRADPPAGPVAEKIVSASKIADETIVAARRISADLRPGLLDNLGLEAAVDWLLREFEARSGVRCALDCALDEEALTGEIPIVTYRILQEALTNIARHAKATEAQVTLETDEDTLKMEVRDNGIGLSENAASAAQARGSLGVTGMRERALQVGGSLALDGAPGQGAILKVVLPLRPNTSAAPEQPAERE